MNDVQLLNLVQLYFGCSSISAIKSNNCVTFEVGDINDIINIIIPHFKKYPLRGTKYLDFCDWVTAAELIYNKEHLTQEGLDKIINLRAGINKSRIYPKNYQPNHTIPSHPSYIPLNGNYISGFVASDGCITIHPNCLLEFSDRFATPSFAITQHINNKLLLESFTSFFPNLTYYKKNGGNGLEFRTTSKNYFREFIIPFFDTYKLYGIKSINFHKIQLILNLINTNHFSKLKGSEKELIKNQIINIWKDDSIKLLGDGTPDII